LSSWLRHTTSAYSDERFKQLTSRVWGGRSYDELETIGGMLIGTPEQVAAPSGTPGR